MTGGQLEYSSADDLVKKLRTKDKIEASKELLRYYARARFRLSTNDFFQQYCDGKNDGGIDFYHTEDNTYFICQSKFIGSDVRVREPEIMAEITKIENTIHGNNPNEKASEFVGTVKASFSNPDAQLEIIWLTTGSVDDSLRTAAQKQIDDWRRKKGIKLPMDFFVIDRTSLDSVIYDVAHGYIPYTGKKTLRLQAKQYMSVERENTGIRGLICTAHVNDLLRWFKDSRHIDQFLQKNVRVFRGNTKINRDIGRSYVEAPEIFWYKHNGIIIFVDNLHVDQNENLVLRNPQIVNGGQTVKALYEAYEKDKKIGESASVLVRIYRLPFEDSETYRKSIDIIAALNTQNKIDPSDLRSTDPRQVRIERLLREVLNWGYQRKKEKGKPPNHTIRMRELALVYYVCKKQAPREGVRSGVEKFFEEETLYDEVFNENAINVPIKDSHIVVEYATCWAINQQLRETNLPHMDKDYAKFTRWLVLADTYKRLTIWKHDKFHRGWRDWNDFIDTEAFRRAVNAHARGAFKLGRQIVRAGEEQTEFYKSTEAYKRFSQRMRGREFEAAFKRALANFEHGHDGGD
jgi:hypothetical protein